MSGAELVWRRFDLRRGSFRLIGSSLRARNRAVLRVTWATASDYERRHKKNRKPTSRSYFHGVFLIRGPWSEWSDRADSFGANEFPADIHDPDALPDHITQVWHTVEGPSRTPAPSETPQAGSNGRVNAPRWNRPPIVRGPLPACPAVMPRGKLDKPTSLLDKPPVAAGVTCQVKIEWPRG